MTVMHMFMMWFIYALLFVACFILDKQKKSQGNLKNRACVNILGNIAVVISPLYFAK